MRNLYREHREFVWLLALATIFRLFAVLLFSEGGYVYDSHPIYDYQFYRRIGELALAGHYPTIDYWLEYPPIFSWAIVGIYRLSLLLPALRDPIFWFHNFLGAFLAVIDAANLTFIYAIESKLSGRAIGLRAAWMYALLFWPLYVMLGWLDPLPLLFLLAAVYGLASNRPVLAGVACGLGFMVKVIPVVVLPAALKAFGSPARKVLALSAAAVAAGIVAVPFLAVRPAILIAGFQSIFARSSWETIWALAEGYFDVGVVAPLGNHVDPATAAWQSHPASLPWPLITALFAVIYLLCLRRMKTDARGIVAFCGLAIGLLLLFSKGYSAQFIVYILPFVVLLLPNGRGIALATLLSLVNALQYPIYAMVFRQHTWVIWLSTGLRTLLWIAFVAICFSKAVELASPRIVVALRRVAFVLAAIVSIVLLAVAWPLLNTFVQERGEYADLQRYLRPLSMAKQGIVLSTRDLIGYAYPFLDGSDVFVLPDDWQGHEPDVLTSLGSFAAAHTQVWLILDYSHGEDARQGFLERHLESAGAKSTNRWFDTFRLVGFVPGRSDRGSSAAEAIFGDTLKLMEHKGAQVVNDGEAFRLSMNWAVDSPPIADYSVFVHVVSARGTIVAQSDKPLRASGRNLSALPAGSMFADADDILVPVGTPPGEYDVLVGLYRPETGERLKGDGGADTMSLGRVQVLRAANQLVPRFKGLPTPLLDGPRVLGYEWPSTPRPGQPATIALYFQSAVPATADYPVSVALMAEGQVVAQTTAVPGDGNYPPTYWRSGEIVRELRQLPAVPSGRYVVGIKIAGEPDAVRSGADGWVTLPGTVTVEK